MCTIYAIYWDTQILPVENFDLDYSFKKIYILKWAYWNRFVTFAKQSWNVI